jgi:hypothetical protein
MRKGRRLRQVGGVWSDPGAGGRHVEFSAFVHRVRFTLPQTNPGVSLTEATNRFKRTHFDRLTGPSAPCSSRNRPAWMADRPARRAIIRDRSSVVGTAGKSAWCICRRRHSDRSSCLSNANCAPQPGVPALPRRSNVQEAAPCHDAGLCRSVSSLSGKIHPAQVASTPRDDQARSGWRDPAGWCSTVLSAIGSSDPPPAAHRLRSSSVPVRRRSI